jgi:hypothetical protein
MSTRFIDGPALGVTLNLNRAPAFLRVVLDGMTQEWDALDQLDDVPGPTEDIYVYLLDGDVSTGFACSRGPGSSGCRRFWHADYRYYAQQPTQEELRNYDFWSLWTKEQWDKLDTKPKGIA